MFYCFFLFFEIFSVDRIGKYRGTFFNFTQVYVIIINEQFLATWLSTSVRVGSIRRIWLGVSIYNNNSEEWMFHLDLYTINSSYPVLNSWFIVTIPHDRFITAWFDEFNMTETRWGKQWSKDLFFWSCDHSYSRTKTYVHWWHQNIGIEIGRKTILWTISYSSQVLWLGLRTFRQNYPPSMDGIFTTSD